MHIAIYIKAESHKADWGGGYSYSERLLRKVLKAPSKHSFTLIIEGGQEGLVPFNSLVKQISYNKVSGDSYLKKAKMYRLVRGISSIFSGLGTALQGWEERVKGECREQNERKFEKLIAQNNIDAVWYPQLFTCANFDVPSFFHLWDMMHYTISPVPYVTSEGNFERIHAFMLEVCRKGAKILVESEAGRTELINYYPVANTKVNVVPLAPGLVLDQNPDEKTQSVILNRLKLTGRAYVLYPAQFWAHKNHITLLQAFEKTISNHDAKLVLTGSNKGSYDLVMEYVKGHELGERVVNLGFVSDEELAVLYRNALAMVFPSMLGPTNMPLLEAAALACPVACSDFAGHREQLGDEGALYFDPYDADDMAQKMELLINDEKLRSTLATKGKEAYENGRFTIENALKSLQEAFDEYEKLMMNWRKV